jgi:hypothetical protein
MLFTSLSSYSFIGHYKFWPNWPSSGVQVVMVKDSAAHCNVVYFPPITVAYFGYDNRSTHNRTPTPTKTFKAATTNKPNKTKINHMQPLDT